MAEKCFFEDSCVDGCRALDLKFLLGTALEEENIQDIRLIGGMLETASRECPNVPKPEQEQHTTRVLAC